MFLILFVQEIILVKETNMEVILKKDVQNIGEAGDIVNVKDGYARNYLLPQNFAEIATKGAKENREKNLARIKANRHFGIFSKSRRKR